MTNQPTAPPKVPQIDSTRLADLRKRICAVVANGELGVALSREDMLALAWALGKVKGQGASLDLPTQASNDSDTWRYLPQRALLVPPHSGPDAIELAADTPPQAKRGAAVEAIEASAIAFARWHAWLAMRVRNGEVSPEAALLAASFAGERRESERRERER